MASGNRIIATLHRVHVPPLLEVTFARKDINLVAELRIPASAPKSPGFEDKTPNWLAKYAT